MVKKIFREVSSMKGALYLRNELAKEQNDVLQEQSFVLAFKGDELKGTAEEKEYFKLLAREAVMKKRKQVSAMEGKGVEAPFRSEEGDIEEIASWADEGFAVPVNCFSIVPVSEVTREPEGKRGKLDEEANRKKSAPPTSPGESASSKIFPL